MGRFRVGIDIGGTHTDVVVLDRETGSLVVEKVSSTPANPALAVVHALAKLESRGVQADDVEFLSHGTTVTTNALLEMRGARVGLLVTHGYRGIQEVQSQFRDGNSLDYFFRKPEPLVRASLTFEIPERLDYRGDELEPLDVEAVRVAARKLREAGVQAIAVCYLFSFMNPSHELLTREILRQELPDTYISLSCEVLPRIREWPRMSTTLLNAYLEPVLTRYIQHLDRSLTEAGVRTAQRYLMQSNGGVIPFRSVVVGANTVRTLLSGPAAGVQAAAYVLARQGFRDLITIDMGGTSCDIAFVRDEVPLEVSETVIARRDIQVPALDVNTIAAGGGSLAWVSAGGFLNVGPRSAGADPGPACYGKGGTQPAVTDADLVLGYLNPEYFLGGSQRLAGDAAWRAIEEHVARPLGMNTLDAASGIVRIVDSRIADEIRVIAAKKGVSPRECTLVAFGGAGPVHAAAVARELGILRVVVPASPGAFSALGLLCADVVHDYVRSRLQPLLAVAPEEAEAAFGELERQAMKELEREGLAVSHAAFTREMDLRYAGQGYELRVPLDGLSLVGQTGSDGGQDPWARLRRRFDEHHEAVHGHAAPDAPVEVVSYRLRVRVAVPKYEPRSRATSGARSADLGAALKGSRAARFGAEMLPAVPVYERSRLDPGMAYRGPAIVEEFGATVVVPPGWEATVDPFGNLLLTWQR